MDQEQQREDSDKIPLKSPGTAVPDYLIIFPLLILGLLLRITAIKAHSFTVDEAGTWLAASRPLARIVPFLNFTNEVHPPFYFYFVHCWMYMGSSEWILRLSSIVFGVLNLLVTWSLAKELNGEKCAFWAAILMTCSSYHITFSQELRMYPMLVFFFLISLWCFVRWLHRGSTFYLVVVTAVNILSMHTHYLTVFLIAVECLYFLMRIREHRKFIPAFLLCQIITVIAFIPWLYHYMTSQHLQDFSLRFIPGLSEVFLLFSYFFMGFHLPPLHPAIGGIKVDPYYWSGMAVAALTLFSLKYQKGESRIFFTIFLLVPLLGITLLSRYTSVRIFEFKYFMIITPVFFILIGAMVAAMRSRVARVLFMAAFITLNGISWLNFAFDERYGPQNWRMASWILQYYAGEKDAILIHPSMMGGGLYYYYHGKNRIVPVDTFDETELAGELSKFDNVWFCTTPFHPYVERIGLEKWLAGKYTETSSTVFPPRSFVLSNVILIKTYHTGHTGKGDGAPSRSSIHPPE
ncbi:MAG: glycosyltransferase family 39 protein [Vulcanimicrobiota bacterium]